MHVQIAGRMHLRRARFERSKRIGHRSKDFVVDLHFVRGLARVEGGVGDHQREHIAHAAGGLADRHKNGQIGNRQARAALSGNIGRGENLHDSRHGRGRGGINRQNLGARVRAQHRRAVQHSRNAHVVDERLFAQGLFKAPVARDGLSDAVCVIIRWRTLGCGSVRTLRRNRNAGAAPYAACCRRSSRLRRPSEWRR